MLRLVGLVGLSMFFRRFLFVVLVDFWLGVVLNSLEISGLFRKDLIEMGGKGCCLEEGFILLLKEE